MYIMYFNHLMFFFVNYTGGFRHSHQGNMNANLLTIKVLKHHISTTITLDNDVNKTNSTTKQAMAALNHVTSQALSLNNRVLPHTGVAIKKYNMYY